MANDTTTYQHEPGRVHTGIDEIDELMELATDKTLCFLCSKPVPKTKQLKESVFSPWILDEYGLREQSMFSQDRSITYYADLKLTACDDCHKVVDGLEKEVKQAILAGPKAVRALDQERLFLWLAKLYHGLFFHDAKLLFNPDNRMFSVFSYRDVVRGFALNHMMLKKLLNKVTWNEFPASIFVFDALTGDEPKQHFDLFDTPEQPFITLRCGSSFIVAALQDFGTLAQYDGLEQWPSIAAADTLRLHPQQCTEISAVFRTLLLQHKPARLMLTAEGDDYKVTVLAPGSIEGMPSVYPWEIPLYDQILRTMFRVIHNTEVVSPVAGPGDMPTLLLDSAGKPLQVPSIDIAIVGDY